ncbi:MAG TPA: VWA domain-containing protein [Vicinamibacterales bacterium]|nr:VWA domain-containing protein [Vicinamibacterales bacterium]
MARGKLIIGATIVTFVLASQGAGAQGQIPPVASFKSSVDMVRIAAVVRDAKGRFVQDLTVRDFEVMDEGRTRAISDLQRDIAGVSIAVLFDVSGSMEGHMPNAREAATHVLSWLDASRDEAAIYTFDTHLDERMPFTTGLRTLPGSLTSVVPFGATSLHDAIALTARRVGEREGRRRAVIVMTDGADNASHLKPSDVSAIASGIDVPVYIFGIVPSIDNPSADASTHSVEANAFAGPLADLAAWTGGHVFVASTPGQRSIAARQIIDELRHQYIIAFESSGKPGWHPLVVRARNKDLIVRARSGYIAGQSRPTAH